MTKPDKELQDTYADLLGDGDPGMARLVRDLDAGYTRPRLTRGAPVLPLVRSPMRQGRGTETGASAMQGRCRALVARSVSRTRRAWWATRPAVLIAALVAVTAALAAGSRINLGKPTNDLPSAYQPIGGFHHVPITLQQKGKPVVLLMGTAVDFQTAVIRWPLVKALTQFGAFVGAKPAPQACHYPLPITPVPPGHYRIQITEPCGPPTFNLTKASYHSAYVAFREDDLLDQRQKVHVSSLSPAERHLYDSYARLHVSNNEAENIAASVVGNPNITTTKRLPLLLIGHYVQTVEQSLFSGDFAVGFAGSVPTSSNPAPYLSFQQTQAGLRAGRIPSKMGNVFYNGNGAVIHDVNTDANLFTALICHADGLKPKRVCSRPTIRHLLKHVK